MVITEVLFYDKNGNLIHQEKGRTLLKQFYIMFYSMLTGESVGYKLVSGSSGHDTFHTLDRITKLVVGSGTTPVAYDDYKIESELTGIDYGNLARSLFTDATQCYIEVVRSVTETEGIDKQINEVAIYEKTDYGDTCIDRIAVSYTHLTLPTN